MVSLRLQLILPFLVLLVLWQNGWALQCFECSVQPCTNTTTKCNGDYCLVVKTNETIVKQACSSDKNACQNDKGCTLCEEDLCNFSSTFGPSIYMIGSASVLITTMLLNYKM